MDGRYPSWTSKYGMVYLEIPNTKYQIPNNKQFRYDYMFYDGQQEKQIATFAMVNSNSDDCYCIFENNLNCAINAK